MRLLPLRPSLRCLSPLLTAVLFGALLDADRLGASVPPTPESDIDSADHLAPFEPFLDKTWRALVDPEEEVYDVARWERAIGGQVVRIVHSVADGAYGGETIVTWDSSREALVYYYFTTAGFYTHGTMSFDEEGRLLSREAVAGDAAGVSEVEATQELLPDGRLRVRTRMKREGVWEDRGEVHYEADPTAEVILPAEGSAEELRQETGVGNADAAEIERVVREAYIEGLHLHRSGEEMRAGFHPAFSLYVVRDGELAVVPLDEWIERIEAWKAAEPELEFEVDWRLERVDVTGDTAVARVHLLRDGEPTFTDYLSLYRFESGWQIVAKVFHDHRNHSLP